MTSKRRMLVYGAVMGSNLTIGAHAIIDQRLGMFLLSGLLFAITYAVARSDK